MTKLEQKQADDTPKITPVQVAVLAYALSFVAAFALAFLFKFTGLFTNVLLATILFSTIALGVVISVLKENELLSKPFGQTILLIAVLGEVVPLLSLTIYSSVVAEEEVRFGSSACCSLRCHDFRALSLVLPGSFQI